MKHPVQWKQFAIMTLAALGAVVAPVAAQAKIPCLTVPEDASQITAVRALIDAGCPCGNYDGTKGKAHAAYVKCANTIIKAQAAVPPGNLRPQCKATVTSFYSKSSCGKNPLLHTHPCITTVYKTGKVKCTIKATTKKDGATFAHKCVDGMRSRQVSCAAYTSCIDAADENDDLVIAAPGDSGACGTTGCYWLHNDTWYNFFDYDLATCKFQDSCSANGGFGSGGGCYRWADCSTCDTIYPTGDPALWP